MSIEALFYPDKSISSTIPTEFITEAGVIISYTRPEGFTFFDDDVEL
jgi:hypothetical protein